MFELEDAVTVRVMAPVQTVWQEVDTIDRLLSYIPEISTVDADPDGRRARFVARLAWGPIEWKMPGTAAVDDVEPPHRLRWTLVNPGFETRLEGCIELAPGADDETVLTYRCDLRCDHKLARRASGMLTGVLEDHVSGLASRVSGRASQHALAERRLRFRDTPGAP